MFHIEMNTIIALYVVFAVTACWCHLFIHLENLIIFSLTVKAKVRTCTFQCTDM